MNDFWLPICGIFGIAIEFIPMGFMLSEFFSGDSSMSIIFSASLDFSKGIFIIMTIPLWFKEIRERKRRGFQIIEKYFWILKVVIETLLASLGTFTFLDQIQFQNFRSQSSSIVFQFLFILYAIFKILRNLHYNYLVFLTLRQFSSLRSVEKEIRVIKFNEDKIF